MQVSAACAGGSHFRITGDVDGVSRTIELNIPMLAEEPESIESAFILRLRSFVKENNITTRLQFKTLVELATFKI